MKDDPRHRVAVAAVIERDGRLLVHQRPPGGWGAGQWEFPGGKLEPGEDPRDAIVRECEEELGVTVVPGAIDEVVCHKYPDLGSIVLLFIRARIVEGAPEPQALEGGAIAWSEPHELERFDWVEADWPYVRTLASGGVR